MFTLSPQPVIPSRKTLSQLLDRMTEFRSRKMSLCLVRQVFSGDIHFIFFCVIVSIVLDIGSANLSFSVDLFFYVVRIARTSPFTWNIFQIPSMIPPSRKVITGKTRCCKVITLRPKNFGAFGISISAPTGWFLYIIHVGSLLWCVNFVLGWINAGNCVRMRGNQNSKSAKIFRRNVMTLQH